MKNLLLISLDCLRADVGYSGRFNVLNKLLKKSVSFTNAISQAPLTPISHATVFTGLLPKNHGIRHLFKEQVRADATTFQQLFKAKGYETGAFVSCPGMNEWYGFGKGFDTYDDEIPRLPDGSDPLHTVDVKLRGSALKRAEVVTNRAIDWLEEREGKPFLLFCHYFDAHWPYEAPNIFGGENPYEGEVAYSEKYFGDLLDYMEKKGLLEDTTIICFSDHGEDLNGWYENDKGGKERGHPEEEGHGCLLYEQTQRVFLTISDTTLPQEKKVTAQVSLVDIFPTICELFELNNQEKLDGQSLIKIVQKNENEDRVAYSETHYPDEVSEDNPVFEGVYSKKSYRIDNKFKIIVDEHGDTEIYDLEKDPLEQNDLTKPFKE